jgi:hypothetical protein
VELGVCGKVAPYEVTYSYRDLIDNVSASVKSRDEENVVIGLQDI